MPLYTLPTTQIFFAHVPKAGGSSVEDYLISRFGPDSISICDKSKRALHKKPGTGLISSPVHFAAVDLEDFLPGSLQHKFAVVRDPLKRVLSQYKFQKGSSLASRFSFSTWLRIMFKAASADPRVYENHIRPQVDLILEDSAIFKLEDGFDNLITWLDEKTGTSKPELTVGHLLKNKSANKVTVYQQDIQLIVDFYKQDYDQLGYSLPEASEYPRDTAATLRDIKASIFLKPLLINHRQKWIR